MTAGLPRIQRSDARDNRERILGAAREIYAAEGLDVPIREIARRAGIGPATLYRHFSTKEILVTEVFTEQMRTCYTVVAEGLTDPDPWRGLCRVIERLCALHARNRGLTSAFLSAYPTAFDFAADREQALTSLAELTRRARNAGRLRPDVTVRDILLLLEANSGIRAGTEAAAVAASRRFAELAIRGLRHRPDATAIGDLSGRP